eukprot:CAMPEP_0180826530 /NCGR_PEP_ID=MMETSP1038_2-20121128/73594_1 /TAXON_ID=632150 /ORGANISM="Azadinium spinosum, Strain 3D9" /LENGTH=110 /DNA_ID=CAMNT_0022869147 /DNA_START=105 /DNA_END=433 /DNA_ORIENTATION=+
MAALLTCCAILRNEAQRRARHHKMEIAPHATVTAVAIPNNKRRRRIHLKAHRTAVAATTVCNLSVACFTASATYSPMESVIDSSLGPTIRKPLDLADDLPLPILLCGARR